MMLLKMVLACILKMIKHGLNVLWCFLTFIQNLHQVKFMKKKIPTYYMQIFVSVLIT